jgi:hypothetical protein
MNLMPHKANPTRHDAGDLDRLHRVQNDEVRAKIVVV